MSRLKTRIIKIVTVAIFLIISCLAWEKNMSNVKKNQSIVIRVYDFSGDPHIHEDVIYYIKNRKCRAFSCICPHLGCKIDIDNEHNCLVCPCHGSKFSLGGVPLSGPADENLIEFKCEVIEQGDAIRVYLK